MNRATKEQHKREADGAGAGTGTAKANEEGNARPTLESECMMEAGEGTGKGRQVSFGNTADPGTSPL